MSLDVIKIAGYKSIKEMRLELGAINILIGANGSGKSNLISFFDFLKNLYEQKLNAYIQLTGGENKLLHKGIKRRSTLSFELEFDKGVNGYGATLNLGRDGVFVFSVEDLIYEGNHWDIGRSDEEAQIKTTANYRAKYIRKHLKSFRKYHFHDTSTTSPFTTPSHIENDQYYLYEDGSNIAAYLYHIREEEPIIYQRIVKFIRSIAPYFLDFFLEPLPNGNIRLQWKDYYSAVVYGATDLSDGTLRFIALTVLFMQPNPPDLIIIDEPELGLHPVAITKLAGLIQSAAAKGKQVLLATQSTDLLSCFELSDVITVDQVEGESQFQRLEEADLIPWLEEYSLGDLWRRNIINTGQPNK